MEPLRPIDVVLRREVDRVTPPVRLSRAEREAERERREQARKRRRQPQESPPEGRDSDGGHLDLLA